MLGVCNCFVSLLCDIIFAIPILCLNGKMLLFCANVSYASYFYVRKFDDVTHNYVPLKIITHNQCFKTIQIWGNPHHSLINQSV